MGLGNVMVVLVSFSTLREKKSREIMKFSVMCSYLCLFEITLNTCMFIGGKYLFIDYRMFISELKLQSLEEICSERNKFYNQFLLFARTFYLTHTIKHQATIMHI